VDCARRAVEASPAFRVSRALLTAALVRLGRTQEAVTEGKEVLELDPTFTTRNWSIAVGVAPDVFSAVADALHAAGIPPE
jgi:hypothetical protein